MAFDLTQMAAQRGIKRKVIALNPIIMTQARQGALARIHRQMIDPWLQAKAKIMPLYESELRRRLQQDNIDAIADLFAQLGDEVSRLILDLTPSMRQWAFGVEQWHRTKWASNLLAGTEIDISQLIGPAGAQESIEDFMARNSALIRNVSDETRAKISDLVYRGLQQRTDARMVGREITRQLGISRRRAVRIASDQANKLSAALDRQRQREAGLEFWKWRHSGKVHYRPDHKARDGLVYTDENAPEDEPGELPFCGCVRQGTLIMDDEVAARIRKADQGTRI